MKDSFSPGNSFSFQVRGDPGAKVSLVAVDNSVFLLSKSGLTQRKVMSQEHLYKMLMCHFVMILSLIRVCINRFGTRSDWGIWAALQAKGRTAWVCLETQAWIFSPASMLQQKKVMVGFFLE